MMNIPAREVLLRRRRQNGDLVSMSALPLIDTRAAQRPRIGTGELELRVRCSLMMILERIRGDKSDHDRRQRAIKISDIYQSVEKLSGFIRDASVSITSIK